MLLARYLPRVPASEGFNEDADVVRKFWRSRWKYGWMLIGVGLAAAVVTYGDAHHWSADALIAIGIAVAAYIAMPPMVVSLNELVRQTSGSDTQASRSTSLTWDLALNDVARELAVAFDTIEDAYDVGGASGVRMERVRTSRRTDSYWQQILARAVDEGHQRVDVVLDEALARSERKPLPEAAAATESNAVRSRRQERQTTCLIRGSVGTDLER